MYAGTRVVPPSTQTYIAGRVQDHRSHKRHTVRVSLSNSVKIKTRKPLTDVLDIFQHI